MRNSTLWECLLELPKAEKSLSMGYVSPIVSQRLRIDLSSNNGLRLWEKGLNHLLPISSNLFLSPLEAYKKTASGMDNIYSTPSTF
jgi:hypothetical protein